MNNTGHALFDPIPLITPEQAKADRDYFMQKMTGEWVHPSTRRNRQKRKEVQAQVVLLHTRNDLGFREIAQQLGIGKSHACKLWREWKAAQ